MVGSMGILALLLTTAAAAAEGGDFTWATDGDSQVQPAGYLYNTPLESNRRRPCTGRVEQSAFRFGYVVCQRPPIPVG